jgi:F0F1-type ATP synthase assembly protein I
MWFVAGLLVGIVIGVAGTISYAAVTTRPWKP